ncbi:nitroreductase family protein [Candidatus Margulisiibacteriota bacterium]
MLKGLVKRNRSYRRFEEKYIIQKETLLGLVDLARHTPSAANKQPLKYLLSCAKEVNEKIFQQLGWAGYLKDWDGPKEGERPSAYIIILGDKNESNWLEYDCGIAAQTILLGAVEKGLGGCIVASVKREPLSKALNLPTRLEIILVIALGKPAEKIVIDEIEKNGDIKYYRDKNDVHHVPKRKLKDILLP